MDLHKLLGNKTWNANPISVGGKPATDFRVGWVNYLDSLKNWAKINCLLNQVLTGFEVENAPFYFKAPKRSIGYAEFISNNRFDLFRKSEITAPKFSQVLRPLGVEDVPGELLDIKGNGRFDSVLYPGAYASTFAGDLIYFVEHGRAPRLKKLIRFLSAPSSDVVVQFELEYGGKTELSPRKLSQGMTRVQSRDSWKTNLGKGDKLYLYSDINKNEGLYARAWDEPQKRGIGIKQPLIWDSNPLERKVWKIKTYIERVGINQYRLTKIIPKSFFADAVFPVYTDTTSTFYPDPDPETNTVDGYSAYINAATWATTQDAATGSHINDVDNTLPIGIRKRTGPLYDIYRAHVYFDTSSIPAGDAISSATFSMYVTLTEDGMNDGFDYMAVVQVQGNNIVSDTSLSTADYDLAGDAIDNPTEGHDSGQRKDITGISTGAYLDFILNSTGIGWIAKSGQQKPSGGDDRNYLFGLSGRARPY